MCALVLACAGLTACGEVSITPPKARDDSAAARASQGQSALTRFVTALDQRDSDGLGQSVSTSFRPEVPRLIAAADKLGVSGLSMQYVDATLGGLTSTEASAYGPGAWLAAVQFGYRLAPDTGATQMEVGVVFAERGGRTVVAGIGGHGDRSPLWMAPGAQVLRAPRLVVVNAGDQPQSDYARLGKQALADVARVLPDWRGTLLIDVPADEQQLDDLLAADPSSYANIAAVTTTVDGSLVPGTPVHVFLNPRVFDTLKDKGAQVVVSHETTHVATKASFADMPVWLLEGFADYVALDHAGVPVQVAAAQILKRIRKDGLPKALPTAGDLEPTAGGLGATYEEAWLACRSIGQHFGERRLVAFYRAIDAGTSVDRAFASVLGTSQKQFVQTWRDDLRGLAGAGVSR